MAKQTFTTGQVLSAAQMTSLQQTAMGGGSTTAKTASYTLVAADAGTVVQMNSASVTTITVNTALFAAGDTVEIQNVGTGVCTVTAGTATVNTSATLALKQYDGGQLYFNSTSAAIFFSSDAADPGASPLTTKGDLYTFTTVDARLGVGANDTVLTADSAQATGLKWAAAAGAPGLAFITGATFTSATTVSINSCFTNTYDNYLVTVNASSGTGGNYLVKLRLSGTDSSASYTFNTLTTNATTVSSATTSGGTIGFPTDANDTSRPAQTQFTLMSPAVAAYTWYASNAFSSNVGGVGVKINNGYHAIATAYDGLTINWTNTSTGTVRVYGLRNS